VGVPSPERLEELPVLLKALEGLEVVHGGIVPDAIRTRGGSLVLDDFAVAWFIAEQRRLSYDGTGTSVGDPRTMAPEVMFGCRPKPASDRFSAAVSLLRLLLRVQHPLGSGAALLGAAPLLHCMALRPVDWIRGVESRLAELPPRLAAWIEGNLESEASARSASRTRSAPAPRAVDPIAMASVAEPAKPFPRTHFEEPAWRSRSSAVLFALGVVIMVAFIIVAVMFLLTEPQP
jgi:serine/threonine protein kinase